ncbi:interferon-inducible GTPase 5-like [Rhinoraja longicauda]
MPCLDHCLVRVDFIPARTRAGTSAGEDSHIQGRRGVLIPDLTSAQCEDHRIITQAGTDTQKSEMGGGSPRHMCLAKSLLDATAISVYTTTLCGQIDTRISGHDAMCNVFGCCFNWKLSQHMFPFSQQAAQSETPTIFTQDELSKLKSDFQTGGVEKIKPMIQNKMKELDETELNVAVTGDTGTGKSTFINAMRGLRSTDEGAAEVGTTETTMERTGYPHPNLPNVRYWDLPGIGSTLFTAGSYLKEMQFKKYDFFIIVTAGRFTENDAKLANEIKRLGKRFYFVRSKIDADLNAMQRERKEFDEEEVLEKIRSDCLCRLGKVGITDPRVFLISSFEQDKYDFGDLTEALEVDLPNIKKRIFVLALPNLSVEIVQKKNELLKKEIWAWAILSGTLGAIPVPGVSLACDIGILIGAIIHFRKCLGLNDTSLQRLADRTGKSMDELKAAAKTPLLGEITPDIIMRIGWGAAIVTVSALELALDFVPVIGSIFGAGSSFVMTFKILRDALKELTESAERVVRVAFDIRT